MRLENLNRLTETAVGKKNPYFLHYNTFHKDLKYAIHKYSKGDLLDIGCGNKPYEKNFESLISKYVGCDVIQSNLNKVDVLCFANKIPLADETFDTLFSTQTIEHVEDHQGLVNEAFRLLRKDGYFIISGPMYWPLHEQPYDFFRFTKHGFKYVLEKSGFEVIEILSNGGMWATAGQALIHAFKNSHSTDFKIRILKSFYNRFKLVWLINTIFLWLDKKNYNPVNTMNYVIIAKK